MSETIPPLRPRSEITASHETNGSLAECIRIIQELQTSYHIHGHGVNNKNDAINVENQGLYTEWNTLQDITHQLNENSSTLAQQMEAWDYNARQYIILIAIPKHPDYFASDVADGESSASENRERSKKFADKHVFETAIKPTGLSVPLDSDKRIPPKMIVGYWDNNQKTFHKNPHFREK